MQGREKAKKLLEMDDSIQELFSIIACYVFKNVGGLFVFSECYLFE